METLPPNKVDNLSSDNPEFIKIISPGILWSALVLRTQNLPQKNIEKALNVARIAHILQNRKDGTKYLLHPLRVALRFSEEGSFSANQICVALLHDVLEDNPEISLSTLEQVFGQEVAFDVSSLSKKIASTKTNISSEDYFSYLSSPSTQAYLKRIKVYDRIDNLESILLMPASSQRETFRQKYLIETDKYFFIMASFDQSLTMKLTQARNLIV